MSGIETQEEYEQAVEWFREDSGFDGKTVSWDADRDSLELKGRFNVKKILQTFQGAQLEDVNQGQPITVSLMDTYVWDVELDIDTYISNWEYNDTEMTPEAQAACAKAYDLIMHCWKCLKDNWDAIGTGIYNMNSASVEVPESIINKYPDIEIEIESRHCVSMDGFISLDQELSPDYVDFLSSYLYDIAQGQAFGAQLVVILTRSDGESAEFCTEGVVVCNNDDIESTLCRVIEHAISDVGFDDNDTVNSPAQAA